MDQADHDLLLRIEARNEERFKTAFASLNRIENLVMTGLDSRPMRAEVIAIAEATAREEALNQIRRNGNFNGKNGHGPRDVWTFLNSYRPYIGAGLFVGALVAILAMLFFGSTAVGG